MNKQEPKKQIPTSSSNQLPSNADTWSREDVAYKWVPLIFQDQEEMKHVSEQFYKNFITGARLLGITKDDLTSFEIVQGLHKDILNAISNLKPNLGKFPHFPSAHFFFSPYLLFMLWVIDLVSKLKERYMSFPSTLLSQNVISPIDVEGRVSQLKREIFAIAELDSTEGMANVA